MMTMRSFENPGARVPETEGREPEFEDREGFPDEERESIESLLEESRQRDEEALEAVREGIDSRAAAEKLQGQVEEAKRMSPDALCEQYRDPAWQRRQEEARPLTERLVNRVQETSRIREWRRSRAQELVGSLAALVTNSGIKDGVGSLVDIGCGQMELTRAIQDRLKEENPELRVIGIDQATYAGPDRLRDDAAFLRAEATDTRLRSGSVDLVNMNYLLQALEEETQVRVLAEAKRILSEKGRLLFLDVVKRGGREGRIDKLKHQALNIFAPYNIRTREKWQQLLEENGFVIEDTSMVGERSVGFLVRVKRETLPEMAEADRT